MVLEEYNSGRNYYLEFETYNRGFNSEQELVCWLYMDGMGASTWMRINI
jgi:hypothetical protein